MRLERWSMLAVGGPYRPREMQAYVIVGDVYGHRDHANGTEVITSRIVTSRIVAVRDGKVHTQSGSIYELGDPHPDYESAYPGARERLVGRGA